MTGAECSSWFSVMPGLVKLSTYCSNLRTKSMGKIIKLWLNLEHKSLPWHCTEFIPTVLKYVSSFPIKDKTALVKRALSWLVTALLGGLLHAASQGQNLSPPSHHFPWAVGPCHTAAPQSFPEGHQGLLRLSIRRAFTLLDFCGAFRTVDSSLPWNALLASGTLYTPGFLIIYLAASLQSHLCFSVSKSQNSSRSSPRVLLTSILLRP